MAKLTREDFISALKEMTILEVKELVDAMKEEFGVDPSAVAVAAAPAAAESAEASTKTVVLKDAGAAKIAVIKVIREITGLGLVEAKGLADKGGNIKENVVFQNCFSYYDKQTTPPKRPQKPRTTPKT